mmetsp:Transcript_83844/g.201132  ORF Transcript_83844/g.201132 Transcript_83844/m.201132 type:complete len:263 (+) Transcript_83844:488-1276(+)
MPVPPPAVMRTSACSRTATAIQICCCWNAPKGGPSSRRSSSRDGLATCDCSARPMRRTTTRHGSRLPQPTIIPSRTLMPGHWVWTQLVGPSYSRSPIRCRLASAIPSCTASPRWISPWTGRHCDRYLPAWMQSCASTTGRRTSARTTSLSPSWPAVEKRTNALLLWMSSLRWRRWLRGPARVRSRSSTSRMASWFRSCEATAAWCDASQWIGSRIALCPAQQTVISTSTTSAAASCFGIYPRARWLMPWTWTLRAKWRSALR